jgi:hypothetical protein
MIILAICALATSVDDEAPHLARETALTLYEARMRLSQPSPIIALRTPDRDAARRLLASLRSRHHDAVACDDEAIPAPIQVRSVGDLPATANILAVVRAVRALRSETTSKVTERKLRPGMALATGGLVMSKKVTREEKRVAIDREELLYLFAREGGPPWIVTERGMSYVGLANAAPTQRENFLRVAEGLRARVPLWDERLLALRNVDDPDEIDLRAQIIAISLSRKHRE